MQGIADAIKYLYQEFILRDVVAYVTPGAIVLAVVVWVVFDTGDAVKIVRDIPKIAYLPLYGVVFVIGLGLENLGEMLHPLRFHNRRENFDNPANARRHQRLLEDSDHFRVLQELHRVAAGHTEPCAGYGSSLERTRERITVKKYASGNMAIAILVSMILIFISNRLPDLKLWATASVGVILIISLLRAHWYQLDLQVIWEDEAVKSHEQGKGGSAKPTDEPKPDQAGDSTVQSAFILVIGDRRN